MDCIPGIVVGWTYSVVVGDFLIHRIVNKLWHPTRWREDPTVRPFAYTPRLVGIVERNLYYFAFIMGYPEFIPIWLALKVAGQWGRWEEDFPLGKDRLPGRIFYNFFLIGTGLSIAYAVVGAVIKKYVGALDYNPAITIGLTLIFASCVLYWLIGRFENNDIFIQSMRKKNNGT